MPSWFSCWGKQGESCSAQPRLDQQGQRLKDTGAKAAGHEKVQVLLTEYSYLFIPPPLPWVHPLPDWVLALPGTHAGKEV